MAKKQDVTDFTKYFIPTDDGVMVDTEIFKHRESLGGKIWNLLRLLSGTGTQQDVTEFEHVPDDLYLARKRFDALRNVFFQTLAERDGKTCKVCGCTRDLTVDHIVPLSRGGENSLENMQILCRKHNSSKGAK
jgi:hypothetical protein